jgi:hypothetical protein
VWTLVDFDIHGLVADANGIRGETSETGASQGESPRECKSLRRAGMETLRRMTKIAAVETLPEDMVNITAVELATRNNLLVLSLLSGTTGLFAAGNPTAFSLLHGLTPHG